MKTLLKVYFIYCLCFLGFLLTRCCDDQPRYYRREGILLRHFSSHVTEIPTKDSLHVDTGGLYYIRVFFIPDGYSRKFSPGNLFINQAYASEACDKAYPPKILDKIDKITVTSNADFDSISPAGANLNDKFRAGWGGMGMDSLSNIERYDGNREMDLVLFKKPSLSLLHRFLVIVYMTNGNVFSSQTAQVRFVK